MNLICPGCRTTNESEAHFCKICGTGFDVQPIRQNSISTPAIVIIVIVAVCGFCELFGLVNSNKTNVGKSADSYVVSTPSTPIANSSENSLSVRSLADTSSSSNTAKPEDGKSATVINENANLRETANSNGEVIQILPENAEVEVVRQKGAWFYVRASGKTGWLHGNTIKIIPVKSKSNLPARKLKPGSRRGRAN